MASRIKWQSVHGETTAYLTDTPGLVTFRSASGWHVGHFPSGQRISTWPWTRAQAEELADRIKDLTDWARNEPKDPRWSAMWISIHEQVVTIENEMLGPITAYAPCLNQGPDRKCMERAGHTGVHRSYGKTWRDEPAVARRS